MRKIQNSKESIKELKKTYRNSAIGKQKAKARSSSEFQLKKWREYAKTPAYKANRRQYYEKNKLKENLMNALARVIRGRDSPILMKHSSFTSPAHVRNHFRRCIQGTNMKMANFGSLWGCDHKIPRSAYNHDNPKDVKRCWSKENVRAMYISANKEKSSTIFKDVVNEVPMHLWPEAWKGIIPGDVV